MRFIRKEFIVTTIFNKDLTDEQEILTVFTNLFNERIEFSMTMRKYMPTNYDYFKMTFEKVRIKKINKEGKSLDLITFKKGMKAVMKSVLFDDILEIDATTTKHKILDIDSDHDRFDILDIREEDE